jgi:hypothetical protein
VNEQVNGSEGGVTRGSFAWAEMLLHRTQRLSDEDLALVLENNRGVALPSTLHDHLIKRLRRQLKPGRKRKDKPTALDFTFADAECLYQEALLRFRHEDRRTKAQARQQGRKLPKGDESASERAYEHVCQRMRKDLGGMGWKALRNQLSLWRACRHPNIDRDGFEPPED